VEPLVAAINARVKSGEGAWFEMDEAESCLEALGERNFVMWSEGIVYKI